MWVFLDHLDTYLFIYTMPLISQFFFSGNDIYTQLMALHGLNVMCSSAAYLLAAWAVGRWTQRSLTATLAGTVMGFSCATVIMALWPTYAHIGWWSGAGMGLWRTVQLFFARADRCVARIALTQDSLPQPDQTHRHAPRKPLWWLSLYEPAAIAPIGAAAWLAQEILSHGLMLWRSVVGLCGLVGLVLAYLRWHFRPQLDVQSASRNTNTSTPTDTDIIKDLPRCDSPIELTRVLLWILAMAPGYAFYSLIFDTWHQVMAVHAAPSHDWATVKHISVAWLADIPVWMAIDVAVIMAVGWRLRTVPQGPRLPKSLHVLCAFTTIGIMPAVHALWQPNVWIVAMGRLFFIVTGVIFSLMLVKMMTKAYTWYNRMTYGPPALIMACATLLFHKATPFMCLFLFRNTHTAYARYAPGWYMMILMLVAWWALHTIYSNSRSHHAVTGNFSDQNPGTSR